MVYCLLEDRDGLIWIATLNGLDVFHPAANRITHYRKIEGNSNSLCDNFVIALCEDHEGSIWIGTETGVTRYCQGQASTFLTNTPTPALSARALAEEEAALGEDLEHLAPGCPDARRSCRPGATGCGRS